MKNRSNLFMVVRTEWEYSTDEEPLMMGAHVVGVYRTFEAADEICGHYIQQRIDGKLPKEFDFEVQIGTYYDE